jgi:hypothetical protein
MTTAKLIDLRTVDDIARACAIKPIFLTQYVDSQDQMAHYTPIKLRKKGKRRQGEFRVVFEAKFEHLSSFHRSVAMVIANSTKFGDHVQGFLKKRSTKTNAEQHLGVKVLLHADIQGFFDAITTQQVQQAFVEAGANVEVADHLAKACTIDGLLRQGTRCSPSIANLVCHGMDGDLLRLANAHGCTYTRYADDITLSGDDVPADAAVEQVLNKHGFLLRNGKCVRQYQGRSQFVTGLSIADPSAPRLPRKLKRQLRMTMHYIKLYGVEGHFERIGLSDPALRAASLAGLLRYAGSIEPLLVSKWEAILSDAREALILPFGDYSEDY